MHTLQFSPWDVCRGETAMEELGRCGGPSSSGLPLSPPRPGDSQGVVLAQGLGKWLQPGAARPEATAFPAHLHLKLPRTGLPSLVTIQTSYQQPCPARASPAVHTRRKCHPRLFQAQGTGTEALPNRRHLQTQTDVGWAPPPSGAQGAESWEL